MINHKAGLNSQFKSCSPKVSICPIYLSRKIPEYLLISWLVSKVCECLFVLPGGLDVKKLYILAKSEDERDHWLAQLSKITLVRDDRPASPSTSLREKVSFGRQKSQRRPSSASTREKASTLRDRSGSFAIPLNPQRSLSVRHPGGRLEQIRSSDLDIPSELL